MVLLPGCACCDSCAYTQTSTATMKVTVVDGGAYSVPACAGNPYPNTAFSYSGITSGLYTFSLNHSTDGSGRPITNGSIDMLDTRTVGGVVEGEQDWTFSVEKTGFSSDDNTQYTLFLSVGGISWVVTYLCRPNGPSTSITLGQYDASYDFPAAQWFDTITYPKSYGYVSLQNYTNRAEFFFGGKTFYEVNRIYFGEFVQVFPLYVATNLYPGDIKRCNGISYQARPGFYINGFDGIAFPKRIDPESILS